MKRTVLQDVSVAQLVESFTSIALDQDKALLWDEIAKYNRLYDKMEVVEEELKKREGDERQALSALYHHSNAQVRLKSAIATLAIAPEEARAVLQKLSDRNEYPQAADARGMLRALDEGRYTPS